MENKIKNSFSEELRFLFETMCKELVDLKLSQLELVNLFCILCHFIIDSATNKCQLDEDVERELTDPDEEDGFSVRISIFEGIDKLIEKRDTFNIPDDIVQNFNKMKNSLLYKYEMPYFIKYFDGNDCLINVLNTYSLKYNFPQSRYEIRFFYDSLSQYLKQNLIAKVFNNHRIKESNSEGWSIKTDDGLIKIEDAAYVWDIKEGAFRFVTKSGNWGFVLSDSHEIIYLPNNIIQMEDFNCFRARVLINDRNKNESFRVDGFWGYIDLRGNFVINETYEKASDFENNIATVSKINIVGEMGMDYCAKNPDSNLQIDVFGNITEESLKKRDEIIKEGEERRKRAKWNEMMSGCGMGDEEIIDAISNGNGDIFGY